MIVASVFFGSMGACLKYALVEIPLYQAIFFRSVVSALLIGMVILGKGLSFVGENKKYLLLRSIAGFIAMSCGFFALSKIPLADASVLHHTSPLFVALFGALLLKERVSVQLGLYIGLAFIGVIFILRPQGEVLNVYGLFALMSGIFAALAYVVVRQLHQTDTSWVIAFHFTTLASLLSLPLMIVNFVLPSPLQWVALLGAGLCGTGGQIFMTAAYRYEMAVRVAPFSYVSVLLSFGFGVLFWGEVPSWAVLFGMLLTVAGGIAIVRLRFPERKTLPSEVIGP